MKSKWFIWMLIALFVTAPVVVWAESDEVVPPVEAKLIAFDTDDGGESGLPINE
jgi:hypothetical protein